ncbi:MAG: glutaredoxin domain-containing protein [Acidimicrobiia bacterium]
MTDIGVRLVVVLILVVVALLVAWVLRRYARPPHPTVDVGEVGDRPGVVLFTSTTCPTCKEVVSLFREMGLPYREVTSDLEEKRFETWGIVAVPVTVVVDDADTVVATFSGVPRRRSLDRAVRSAGIAYK